ncbi:MAG: hypothetical protein ACK4OF_05335, partial [Aquificaceae bacterium]
RRICKVIVPPRYIRRYGRSKWKEDTGYSLRSLVENAFYRMKKTFGSYLRSKLKQMQEVEIRIRCLILKRNYVPKNGFIHQSRLEKLSVN